MNQVQANRAAVKANRPDLIKRDLGTDEYGNTKYLSPVYPIRPDGTSAGNRGGRRSGGTPMSQKDFEKLKEEKLVEKAPSGAKFERMVKHIKKKYAKDGLTKKEKSIAYATAWKAKNKEEMKEAIEAELKKNLGEKFDEIMEGMPAGGYMGQKHAASTYNDLQKDTNVTDEKPSINIKSAQGTYSQLEEEDDDELDKAVKSNSSVSKSSDNNSPSGRAAGMGAETGNDERTQPKPQTPERTTTPSSGSSASSSSSSSASSSSGGSGGGSSASSGGSSSASSGGSGGGSNASSSGSSNASSGGSGGGSSASSSSSSSASSSSNNSVEKAVKTANDLTGDKEAPKPAATTNTSGRENIPGPNDRKVAAPAAKSAAPAPRTAAPAAKPAATTPAAKPNAPVGGPGAEDDNTSPLGAMRQYQASKEAGNFDNKPAAPATKMAARPAARNMASRNVPMPPRRPSSLAESLESTIRKMLKD